MQSTHITLNARHLPLLALPTKPLNSINLSDADMENSMVYLADKIGSMPTLSMEETQFVNRLGGRMIDLDLVITRVIPLR